MKKQHPLIRNMKQHWQLYVMIAPIIIYFLIFSYAPLYGIQIAFRKYFPGIGISEGEWVGLYQFERLFRNNSFKQALLNTLTLSGMQIILGFPFPLMMAILLNEVRLNKAKKFLQTVSYAPHFISTVAMAGIVLSFCSNHGIIGQIYSAVTGETVNLISKADSFKWIYFLSTIWKNLGWSSIIYVSALSSIDVSLYDAAKVDGANRLQKIWYLDLPSLMPTATILLIMNCGRVLSVGYEYVLMLQNDLNLPASEIISTYSYQMGLISRDYSYSTAIGLFNSVVNMILLITVNKISRKLSNSSLW